MSTPILHWCAENPTARFLDPSDLATGEVLVETIDHEIQRLIDAKYLTGKRVNVAGLMAPRLTERGLRASGVWPSEDSYDALLTMLNEMISASTSDEDRTRLVRLRDSVVGLGRDIGVNLLSAFLQTRIGI